MNLFVFGLGFSATAAVNQLSPSCNWVAATTRSEDKAKAMAAKGIRAHVYNGETQSSNLLTDLNEATHIIMSIAPGDNDPVLNHYESILKASTNLQWVGYFSTVGVYGNHDGAWVDETSECRPVSLRSRQRIAAEEAWTNLGVEASIPVAILRLAGIYGPGRNTFVNFKKGIARRIIKPHQVFNRIHVDDIALMVEAIANAKQDGIFNATDNKPAPPQDVVEYAANLMGAPVPPDMPFEESNLSPMGRSFYGENKKVSNTKIKALMGRDLKQPTYKEALTNLWENGNWDEKGAIKSIR